MKIDGSVALVTGAGRGLGRVYARELVRQGAVKVYGAARDPDAVTEPGVTPVALDITDPQRVAEVAAQCCRPARRSRLRPHTAGDGWWNYSRVTGSIRTWCTRCGAKRSPRPG
jgi:NAD(P)-dependent dehydrogenase (short-subunit alcohol dehydrogenase family)